MTRYLDCTGVQRLGLLLRQLDGSADRMCGGVVGQQRHAGAMCTQAPLASPLSGSIPDRIFESFEVIVNLVPHHAAIVAMLQKRIHPQPSIRIAGRNAAVA